MMLSYLTDEGTVHSHRFHSISHYDLYVFIKLKSTQKFGEGNLLIPSYNKRHSDEWNNFLK